MKNAARKILTSITLSLLATSALAGDFSVTSADYVASKTVPTKNVFHGGGCLGDNLSPDISWKNAPAGTQSFAITIYDPDAPTGSGWWHWTVINIPASVMSLPEGASGNQDKMPATAIEGRTDFGTAGYGGPCPPVGDTPHHYIATVYALKTAHLDLTPDSSGAMIGFYLNRNALAKASVTSIYGR